MVDADSSIITFVKRGSRNFFGSLSLYQLHMNESKNPLFLAGLAGEPGFEPRLLHPECSVLPLYDSPKFERAVFYHAHGDEARGFSNLLFSTISSSTASIIFNI